MVQSEMEEMAGGRRGADPDREVTDRLRRIETRLTGFMQWSGYETGSDRPTWADGVIHVPTPGVSLRDIMAVIPPDWQIKDEIEIHHRGVWVASIFKPDA